MVRPKKNRGLPIHGWFPAVIKGLRNHDERPFGRFDDRLDAMRLNFLRQDAGGGSIRERKTRRFT